MTSSPLEDLYKELILDHYKKPRNRADGLADEDVHVHHTNPFCGDELDLHLKVGDGQTVEGIAFHGDGCSISMASASAMTEAVAGRDLADAEDLVEAFRLMMHGEDMRRDDDLKDGVAFQGVAKFPVRVKCALLGWMALKDAIETHRTGDAEHRVTHEQE